MGAMASQITSVSIVYSTVCPGIDQRKHQSSASLAFVRGIHRGPVNSPHKGPVTRKMFPFDDVIMISAAPMIFGQVADDCDYSCMGRCDEEPGWDTKFCHCDELCVRLGDCCLDYEYHCNEENDVSNDTHQLMLRKEERFAFKLQSGCRCSELAIAFKTGYDWMETGLTTLYIFDNCTDVTHIYYSDCLDHYKSLHHATPVCAGGYIFRNVYCAVCNGYAVDKIASFNATFTCDEEKTIPRGRDQLSFLFQHCEFHISPSAQCMRVYHRSICMFRDGSDCHNTETPHDTIMTYNEIACETYNSPVEVNIGDTLIVFKNIFCADCVDTSNYFCGGLQFELNILLVTGSIVPSFSTLLDFGRVFGSPGNSAASCQGAPVDDHVSESRDTMESTERQYNIYITFTNTYEAQTCEMTYHDLSNIANASDGYSFFIFHSSIEKVILQHNCEDYFFIHEGLANNGSLSFNEMTGILNGIIDWWAKQSSPSFKILREIGVVPLALVDNITCVMCTLELNDIDVGDDHNNLTVSEFLGHDKIYSLIFNGNLALKEPTVRRVTCVQKEYMASVKDFVNNNSHLLDSGVCERRRSCKFYHSYPSTTSIHPPSLLMVIEAWTTFVCNILSLVGLAWTLITYSCFPALRNIPGKALLCLVSSLAIAHCAFQFSVILLPYQIPCLIICLAQQYFWLSSFTWMNVLAFDIIRGIKTLSSPDTRSNKVFVWYSLYAWCVPASLTAMGVALMHALGLPYMNEQVCWLAPGATMIYTFVCPLSLAILGNLCAFIMFVHHVRKLRAEIHLHCEMKDKKSDLVIYLKLFSLMGLTWVFGLIANIEMISWFSYVFTLTNTLQGVFIFFVFGVSPKARTLWTERIGMRKNIIVTETHNASM